MRYNDWIECDDCQGRGFTDNIDCHCATCICILDDDVCETCGGEGAVSTDLYAN